MDYRRKQRWVRYRSDKCKLYLRNDFHFECAYCGMSESDAGVVGENYFEKDHFLAQALASGEDVDVYSNMVYACRKCNNRKTNREIRVLLDPCKDDIYSGANAHVYRKTEGDELGYRTEQGRQFIESMNLNSAYYCKMRRRQREEVEIRKEFEKCKRRLREEKVSECLIEEIERSLSLGNMECMDSEEWKCGTSFAGECLKNVLDILKQAGIAYELLLEDHDVDVEIMYNDELYRCEVVLNKNAEKPIEHRHYNTDKITWTAKQEGKYGELYYYAKTQQLEIYLFVAEGIERICICG